MGMRVDVNDVMSELRGLEDKLSRKALTSNMGFGYYANLVEGVRMAMDAVAAVERGASDATLMRRAFADVHAVSDLNELGPDEADEYGIWADEGHPFYTAVRNGYLLVVVHQDGEWGAGVYGMGYGDCWCSQYGSTADDALANVLATVATI